MSEHSPLPWHCNDEDKYPRDILHGEELIATAYPMGMVNSEAIGEANARFIVRACNSHEALMVALRRIATEHVAYEQNEGGSYGIGVTDGHRCAAKIAREALALVEDAAAEGADHA